MLAGDIINQPQAGYAKRIRYKGMLMTSQPCKYRNELGTCALTVEVIFLYETWCTNIADKYVKKKR